MGKYLIVNADDFGMCHSANLAVIQLLEEGAVTSSTAMAPCPWFPEAAAYARSHPEKCIGLHLTFTSEWAGYRWGPVSRAGVSSLVREGYFPPDVRAVERASHPEEVKVEIEAQLALARSLGLEPSHLDNHMGSLYGVAGIQSHLPLVFQVCAAQGLPFRLPTAYLAGDSVGDTLSPAVKAMAARMGRLAAEMRVPVLDCLLAHPFAKLPGETYESFRESICAKLDGLPEGVHEIFIHPAVDSPEIRAIHPHWEKRTWELRLFRDPQVRACIAHSGIQLVNWRDIRRLRGL